MIRVLYDSQIFDLQRYGGISRYHFNLFYYFKGNKGNFINPDISIEYSDNEYIKNQNFINILPAFDPYNSFITSGEFPSKRRIYEYFKRLFKFSNSQERNKENTIQVLKRQNFDIFHPTFYDNYFLPFLGKKPFVITIHDLIPELYTEFFLNDPTLSIRKELIEKSSKIIAVSETTKQDLISLYDVNSDKIDVIYHPFIPIAKSNTHQMLPKHFLLYVGNRKVHKNFYFFLRAFAKLKREDFHLQLVCVGEPFTNEEVQFINNLGISHFISCNNYSDDQLQEIYSLAKALVIPSLYEGFGIPILEAAVNRCKLVLSDIRIFREIVGDDATFFNPKNLQSIISAIEKALDAETGKYFNLRGKYSLFEFLKKHEETYNSVLN